jgi:hypothetical protein
MIQLVVLHTPQLHKKDFGIQGRTREECILFENQSPMALPYTVLSTYLHACAHDPPWCWWFLWLMEYIRIVHTQARKIASAKNAKDHIHIVGNTPSKMVPTQVEL